MADLPLTRERIEEIVAGCEGVTPGPYFTTGAPWFRSEDGVLAGSPDGNIGYLIADCDDGMNPRDEYTEGGGPFPLGDKDADAAHFARLDPATVRALCALALKGMDAEAAAPQPAQVAVKPLEWHRHERDDLERYSANPPLASFIITRTASGFESFVGYWGSALRTTMYFWELDDAKAAAQADYETRIRSALAPSPADGAVEALADCIALLDALAESALKDDDTATWAMCSVMADKHRPALAKEPDRATLERLASMWDYTLEETADSYGAFLEATAARPLPPVHAQPDGWRGAIQKAAHIASLHSHHALWRGLIPYGWSEDVEKFGCGLAERIANAILEDDNRPLDSWRDFVSDPPPRDGNKVDLWQGGMRVPGAYWSDVQEAWCVDGEFGPKEPTPLPIIPAPTHWRPLPPAPTAEEV